MQINLDKTKFFRIFVKNHEMQLIRVKKKTNGKLDQAKTILSLFCLLSGINLSDTELTVLSYFLVYKVNDVAKKLILNGKILKSEDSLKNTVSKLKKFGLLKKTNSNKEYVVNEEVDVPLDSVVAFLVKVDNK